MPTLSQINLYQVLIILFILTFSSFVGLLFLTLYYWLHGSHKSKKVSTVDPRDVAVTEAIKIVDEARQKAMGLLNEAHIEAKSILEGSQQVESSTKEVFNQKLQDIAQRNMGAFDLLSQDLLNSFKTVLSQEKETSLRSLSDVSGALKEELSSEVHSFTQNIKKVTADTESTLKNDINLQYQQVAQEMQNLSSSLKSITAQTENALKENLGGQYELVNKEMSSMSQNIKAVAEEAQATVKNNLLGGFDEIKKEVDAISDELKSVTDQAETMIKEDITNEYKQAQQVVHNFSESLKNTTIETETNLKKEILDEFEKVKQDIVVYQDEKMKKFDNVLKIMLEDVARDVLGKTMNSKDHEEIILKSLESIKRSTNLKQL